MRGRPALRGFASRRGHRRSYSIDTIGKVRAGMAAGDELFFIIGADAFADLRTWYRWRDVAQAVQFVVVSRPGKSYEAPAGVRFERLDSVAFPVSSSEIRQSLALGERPSAVPPQVLEYIREHALYGSRVPA